MGSVVQVDDIISIIDREINSAQDFMDSLGSYNYETDAEKESERSFFEGQLAGLNFLRNILLKKYGEKET